jgi:hypothetical protein
LLLDAEVRIEFDGKNLRHALRERRYLARIPRRGGTPRIARQLQRAVVLARELQQVGMALHRRGCIPWLPVFLEGHLSRHAAAIGG